jgi:hypothetical protein
VWTCAVVVRQSDGQCDTGLRQRGEQRLVQELIAQPAVEALDEAILHRLSGRDVMPLDPGLIFLTEDGVGHELGRVVADNHLRFAAADNQLIQFPGHPNPTQRGVCHERQAFARAVIDAGEDAEAPTVGELI